MGTKHRTTSEKNLLVLFAYINTLYVCKVCMDLIFVQLKGPTVCNVQNQKWAFYCGLDWVQSGDKWPSLTCDNEEPQRLGETFRLISKLWNVQKSSYSQHIHMMMKLWPWLLSFLLFFKVWVSRSDFSRRMSAEDSGLKNQWLYEWWWSPISSLGTKKM